MFHFMLRMTIDLVPFDTLPSFDYIVSGGKHSKKTRRAKRRGPRHAKVVVR